MSSDSLIRFEEDNWTELAEKFIEKNLDSWDEFVHDQYVDSIENEPEPKDMREDR